MSGMYETQRVTQEHVLLHAASAKPRLLRRIERTPGGCWLWLGSVNGRGYGTFAVGPRATYKCLGAHRAAYILLVGPIPHGLELDHLCRTPRCVNPAHLEPVTHQENMRRGHAARRAERERVAA